VEGGEKKLRVEMKRERNLEILNHMEKVASTRMEKRCKGSKGETVKGVNCLYNGGSSISLGLSIGPRQRNILGDKVMMGEKEKVGRKASTRGQGGIAYREK